MKPESKAVVPSRKSAAIGVANEAVAAKLKRDANRKAFALELAKFKSNLARYGAAARRAR